MHHGSDISVQTVEAASKSSFPTISTSLMAASTFQGRGGESLLQFVKPNFTALDFYCRVSIPVLSAPSLEPRQVRRTSAMQHERGVLLYSISNLQITVAWFSQNRSAQEKDLVSEVESQPSGWRLQVPPACQIKTWEHCSIKMKSQKKIRNS